MSPSDPWWVNFSESSPENTTLIKLTTEEVFQVKIGNFKTTRDFSPLNERVLAGVALEDEGREKKKLFRNSLKLGRKTS